MLLTDSIKFKLEKAFSPLEIKVVDTSPEPTAGHVQIRVVSKDFVGMSSLDRHKRIYEVLKEEIMLLHAISVSALTPQEASSS